MEKPNQIIELIINEEDGMNGVNAISIVHDPAMESEFMLFSKNAEFKFKSIDTEKKLVMGALLIPNKMILREIDGQLVYVFFSQDTIRRSSELFLKNGFQNNATLEHTMDVNNLTLVESWIIEDSVHDKSRKYGMEYPIGTWMGTMKISDDEIWEEIVKTGMVKGFSIEGFYQKGKTAMTEIVEKEESILQEIIKIIKSIDENTTE